MATGAVKPADAVRAAAQIPAWVTTNLEGDQLAQFDNYIAVLGAAEASNTFDVRRALVSGEWQAPDALRVTCERLHAGARLSMAVIMESVMAVAVDDAAYSVGVLLGGIVFGASSKPRRRATGLTESAMLHSLSTATMSEILEAIDRQRPLQPRCNLARQPVDEAASKKRFGRRLYEISKNFRKVQVWGLTDWLSPFRALDHSLMYCVGLFAIWGRMREIVAGEVGAGALNKKIVDELKEEYEVKSEAADFVGAEDVAGGAGIEAVCLDWDKLVDAWGTQMRTPSAVLRMILRVTAVLSEMQACRIPAIIKTPVIASYMSAEDELLNLIFNENGEDDGDDSFVAFEGRGADVEHFLDRNAKITVGTRSVPSLSGFHLVEPVCARVDKVDAVIGFVVLPHDWQHRDRSASVSTELRVGEAFNENVLVERCYAPGVKRARGKFPSVLSHVFSHYTVDVLQKLAPYGLFVPLDGAKIVPGVATGETFSALRKSGTTERVKLMPVIALHAANTRSTLFQRLTGSGVAAVENAALFERCMIALAPGGVKTTKGARMKSGKAAEHLIAQESVRRYRTHALSFMRAALLLGRKLGGDELTCLMRALCAACATGADASVVGFELTSAILFGKWRELAMSSMRSVIDDRANLLCLCSTAGKIQKNELKLCADIATPPWIFQDPAEMEGGGRFAPRESLGRKLKWTLDPVTVEPGKAGIVYLPTDPDLAYAASVYCDGGDWFSCLEIPPSIPPSAPRIHEFLWYRSVGFRMFDKCATTAIEDGWEALTHLNTARREVVASAAGSEMIEKWQPLFDALKKDCYIGLKRVDEDVEVGNEDFRKDLCELEVRMRFGGRRRPRQLPITWCSTMNMAVVGVRASGVWC